MPWTAKAIYLYQVLVKGLSSFETDFDYGLVIVLIKWAGSKA